MAMNHERYMDQALCEARAGFASGSPAGIPIGCVIVRGGRVVARGHNQRVQRGSVILHAEMDALENLGRRKRAFYEGCTLFTTLAPCSMCSGAVILYGIRHVVVGERKTFPGETRWLRRRGVTVEVLDDPACYQLLAEFRERFPGIWNEDIGR